MLLCDNFRILIRISLTFIPEGPVHNKSSSGQEKVWRRIADKILPETMLIHFTDAYTRP